MTLPLFDVSPPTPANAFGEVLTKRWVVEAILDLAGYTRNRDLSATVLVEPSAGRGAFLLPAIERLLDCSATRHGDFTHLGDCVRAFELQEGNVARCRALVHQLLTLRGCPPAAAEALARTWVRHGDFLLSPEPPDADVVVGNPPYIRIEDTAPATQALYRQLHPTMRGRADIYVGFIEKSLRLLKPGGVLGFICADRWMHNQYGAALRALVATGYSVDSVWKMHDVDAFETPVSAYPAITILRNAPQSAAVVADTTAAFDADAARHLAAWTSGRDATATTGSFTAHRLPHWFGGGELWPTGSPDRLALIEHLNDNFGPLHDPATGTRVGIGVATGADKVFITKDPAAAEPGRLLPLSMVGDLKTGSYTWSGHYLVNPWDAEGRLVDLDDHPRLKVHFTKAAATLRGRHVAQRNPAAWYRTIDKVTASLTAKPKLLLQDMRASIHPVLEDGGRYPHHNLYYVTSDTWDMEVLGGLLLSRVAQAFIEAYAVRMRGGTLRFQAQYLKQIRVPRPDSLAPDDRAALRAAFRTRDQDAATTAAIRCYGIGGFAHSLGVGA